MIKVSLAEDQQMLNSALTAILNLEEDIDVVSSSLDGEMAYQDIKFHQPDIVILDIEMPKLTGLDVAEALKQENFKGKIIILTTFARQDYFERAVTIGVEGYLLKDNPTENLVKAIHDINHGDIIYSPELVRNVLRPEKNPLTAREMEILGHIAAGYTTQVITEKVFLSQGTVRNYISSILSKTGAQSRVEAVNIARKHQWLN